jgi:hypothetical protein
MKLFQHFFGKYAQGWQENRFRPAKDELDYENRMDDARDQLKEQEKARAPWEPWEVDEDDKARDEEIIYGKPDKS